jgi:hypothetical protein
MGGFDALIAFAYVIDPRLRGVLQAGLRGAGADRGLARRRTIEAAHASKCRCRAGRRNRYVKSLGTINVGRVPPTGLGNFAGR